MTTDTQAGRRTDTQHTVLASRLGELTIVRDGEMLTGLYFPHHWYRPSQATFGPRTGQGFADVTRQLGEYLDGNRTEFDLPLDARGSDFQRSVWERIAEIPYGHTTSYGDLARRLGGDADPRDVGAAVGRNPLSILIPCHRVVGSTGKLTGYAGGLTRKRTLLDLEQPGPTGLW
jgi:methylated-DNA-[protein]-cysteine S-methyltransferase